MQLFSSFDIKISSYLLGQQVLANNLEACAFKPRKPRGLCLNAGPITDTGLLLASGAEPLTSLKATGTPSSSRNPSPPLQRAAEGRVKEWLSPPFPKTRCLRAQKLWRSVTCTNPFFPLLYIHVLYLRLSTPQSNRYDCISNPVLRGSGMLVSSPGSQTHTINPSRYLRVLSGDWADTVCACSGTVPRWAGNPARSSRGVTEDG